MSKKALLEDEILINLAISDFKNSWLKVVKLFERPKGTTTFQPLFIFLKFLTKHSTGKWTSGGGKERSWWINFPRGRSSCTVDKIISSREVSPGFILQKPPLTSTVF